MCSKDVYKLLIFEALNLKLDLLFIFSLNPPWPRIRSQTTGVLFACQRTLNKKGVIFLLHIKTNSCSLYSTCMCDKLATSACGVYLLRAISFISKCEGIEPCFNSRLPVRRRCDVFESVVYLLVSLATGNLLFIDRLVSSDSAWKVRQLQPHLQAVRDACNFYLKSEQ